MYPKDKNELMKRICDLWKLLFQYWFLWFNEFSKFFLSYSNEWRFSSGRLRHTPRRHTVADGWVVIIFSLILYVLQEKKFIKY